jgi:internalin A
LLGVPGAGELALTYRLPSRQAGIPSWFIAREHRYTTGVAWSRGVLLRHHDHTAATAHGDGVRPMALLEDDAAAQPTLRLTVRGPAPHVFYSILDEAFTGILAERYPGLRVRRLIPCPCIKPPAARCAHEFDYADAERALQRQAQLQCPKSLTMRDPRTLLLGLSPTGTEKTLDQMNHTLTQIAGATTRIEHAQLRVLDSVRDLLRHRAEQGTHCPSIFTLTRTRLLGYELRLYCEQPDALHPLGDGDGVYRFWRLPHRLRRYAPYLHVLLTGLRYALPLATPPDRHRRRRVVRGRQVPAGVVLQTPRRPGRPPRRRRNRPARRRPPRPAPRCRPRPAAPSPPRARPGRAMGRPTRTRTPRKPRHRLPVPPAPPSTALPRPQTRKRNPEDPAGGTP